VEHIAATVTFSCRCKSLGRTDTELAGQVNQCEKYWKSLLPATFSFCHKVYCWARTGVQRRWWKRWIAQKFFSKIFSKFFSANVQNKKMWCFWWTV